MKNKFTHFASTDNSLYANTDSFVLRCLALRAVIAKILISIPTNIKRDEYQCGIN